MSAREKRSILRCVWRCQAKALILSACDCRGRFGIARVRSSSSIEILLTDTHVVDLSKADVVDGEPTGLRSSLEPSFPLASPEDAANIGHHIHVERSIAGIDVVAADFSD